MTTQCRCTPSPRQLEAGAFHLHLPDTETLPYDPFSSLLRAVTIDPAMLAYLDGRQSSGRAPNENYGREVMEIFTLGVGNS